MSKALQLAYTLHPKTLTNPLLANSLTKPLTHFKSMYFYKFSIINKLGTLTQFKDSRLPPSTAAVVTCV